MSSYRNKEVIATMKNQQVCDLGLSLRRTRHRRRGISLVELLLSLAIAALILAATAAAFDAAFNSYQVNHEIATTGMTARNGLHQMTSTIRSAWNDPDVATIDVDEDTGNRCSLVDADGRDIIYRYDPINTQLEVSVDDPDKWYVMMENVYPISADKPIFAAAPPEGDFAEGTLGQVEIHFKIIQGNTSRAVSATAVPRNVIYSQ